MQAPFGTYRPTAAQSLLIRVVRVASPRGSFRSLAAAALKAIRPGPIDATFDGVPFRFELDSPGDRMALFAPGRCDRVERRLIAKNMGPGGTFVDIGASIGIYSIGIAVARPDAHVLAFEPEAGIFERLSFNIASAGLDDRITARAVALGDHAGTLSFDRALGTAASSTRDAEFPVDTLAGALRSAGVSSLDALKIDIEGFEDRVLYPFYEATNAALWPRVVVIEHVFPNRWHRNCLTLLADRGYETVWRGALNTVLLRRPAPAPRP